MRKATLIAAVTLALLGTFWTQVRGRVAPPVEDGTEAVSRAASLVDLLRASRIAWKDFDADGYVDFVVGTAQGDKLFRRLPDGRFEETSVGARPTEGPPGVSAGAVPPAPGGNGQSSTGDVRCAETVRDQSTTGCLHASSVPVQGMIYVISKNLFVDATTRNVGIGTTTPAADLQIQGNLSVPLTGTFIKVAGNSKITGNGSDLGQDGIQVGDAVQIGSDGTSPAEIFTVSGIDLTVQELTVSPTPASNGFLVPGFRDSDLLSIAKGDGVTGITVDNSGNVGIATTAPAATLDVNGPIRAVGTGGNVPHGCVVRSTTIFGLQASITCQAGETAIAGGGSCDSGSLRGSIPTSNGWQINCQNTGNNQVHAICCQDAL